MPKKDYPIQKIGEHLFKKCSTCLEVKLLTDYYLDLDKSNGVRTQCIECTKIRLSNYRNKNKEKINLKRIEVSYNLTEDEFKLLKEKQNNICAICKNSMLSYRGAHIDHDTQTDKVRGLLCLNCNLGIGSLKHDIEILINAIIYLSEMPSEQVNELRRFLEGKNQ